MIHDAEAEHALRDHARSRDMKTLREDALRYVTTGETTLEEVLRVTR